MIGSKFHYLTDEQTGLIKDRVFDLLADYGVKLDPHPELFDLLAGAGAEVDRESGMVRFPRQVMKDLLALAPVSFKLGAYNHEKSLTLPRPDGTFYGRSAGGCHGWIDPETGEYEKVTTEKFAGWVHLINHLDEINLLSMLFCNDAPVETADVYSLAVLLKHTDKSIWVQPYSSGSVEYLISLGEAAAGGGQVTLTWSTAAEDNTCFFNIYRDRERIASVPAFGEAHSYCYVDRLVTNGVTYSYQLSDSDFDGTETWHRIVCTATPRALPLAYSLSQNYPNPFNASTEICYQIPKAGHVTLMIYNTRGQLVQALAEGKQMAGGYAAEWDGRDGEGREVASGLYFCRLKAGSFAKSIKMVLAR